MGGLDRRPRTDGLWARGDCLSAALGHLVIGFLVRREGRSLCYIDKDTGPPLALIHPGALRDCLESRIGPQLVLCKPVTRDQEALFGGCARSVTAVEKPPGYFPDSL
jgi:hypothetical protein